MPCLGGGGSLFEHLGIGHGGAHFVDAFPADFVLPDADLFEVTELAEGFEGSVCDAGQAAEFEELKVCHFLKDAWPEPLVRDGGAVGNAKLLEGAESFEMMEGGVGEVVEHQIQLLE